MTADGLRTGEAEAKQRSQSPIAALYVEKDGAYFGLEGVDPWDEERDARLYAGPWPVVAHPPCNKWQMTEIGPDGRETARWVRHIGCRWAA